MKISRSGLLILGIFLYSLSFSQSAKKLSRDAEGHFERGEFNLALPLLDQALALEANYSAALLLKGKTCIKLSKFADAETSLRAYTSAEPKEQEGFWYLAEALEGQTKYAEAIQAMDQMLALKPKYTEGWIRKAYLQIKARKFDQAISSAREAAKLDEENPEPFLIQGISGDSLNNNQVAEQAFGDFIKLARINKNYRERQDLFATAHAGQAKAQLGLYKYDLAIYNYAEAVSRNPSNETFIIGRARAFAGNKELQRALQDYAQALKVNAKSYDAWYERALIYKQLGQFASASDDLNQALLLKPETASLYSLRATCFEAAKDLNSALRDARKASVLEPSNKEYSKLLATISEKHYEANKEEDAPKIILTLPRDLKDSIVVPASTKSIVLEGMIMDASGIKSLLANGASINIDENEKNPSFSTTIPIEGKQKLSLQATDVYFNTANWACKIIRSEENPPVIEINHPTETAEHELYFEPGAPMLIEGRISDESKIKQLLVDGKPALFSDASLNPIFRAEITSALGSKILVEATDVWGNKGTAQYSLKTEDTSRVNRMGKTWVICIDNMKYERYTRNDTSLKFNESTAEALSSYAIDRIIEHENVSLNKLKEIFSVAFREEMKQARVRSLLVLYNGFGMIRNEAAYWLPVDGDTTKSETAYSLQTLTAWLETCVGLNHVLLVDAGTPYTAYASNIPKIKRSIGDCVAFKNNGYSAQIINNNASVQAAGRTLFMQAFSTILSGTSACIPAEQLNGSITDMLSSNKLASCTLGDLKGLKTGDGSFCFLKR
jgi:tetratricopeptide (TPR) repeat protein